MHMLFSRPSLTRATVALLLGGAALAVTAQAKSPLSNEALTQRHFASLLAGPAPKTAELTLFFSMMPKGGDLHHHYSGALYAEQFLDWVDQSHYCVNKTTYRIETDAALVAAELAKPAAARACVTGADAASDQTLLTALLQRWSSKDFHHHSGAQSPPDRQFFDTFGYFGPVASNHAKQGLQTLKQRAIEENLSYIETIYELAPFTSNTAFDRAALDPAQQPGMLIGMMTALKLTLEQDPAFRKGVSDYVANVETASAGIDDERFTMRYQPYVLRFLSPSQVFSSMLAAFQAASTSKLIVGVNIVGQESVNVSMRDYRMHMQMFNYLKRAYPDVKLALHAGELALGLVPPEGLTFHIRDAIEVAGASRIGHGIDLAHETDALGLLKTMRERDIAVEINLTSNEFILGVKNEAHPLNLYRKYGVPFVIATDDAGVSRNNLSNEYVLFASRYKTDYAEVKKLSYNSLKYSFLPGADKQRLLKQLDGRFATFEAKIAAGAVIKP